MTNFKARGPKYEGILLLLAAVPVVGLIALFVIIVIVRIIFGNHFGALFGHTFDVGTIALGVVALLFAVTLFVAYRILKSSVRAVDLNYRRLQLTPVLGKPIEYPLATTSFDAEYQQLRNHDSSSQATAWRSQRSLLVTGVAGTKRYHIGISPLDYAELIDRLTGPNSPQAKSRGHQAGVHLSSALAPQGSAMPLSFQPRTFQLSHKGANQALFMVRAIAILILAGAIWLNLPAWHRGSFNLFNLVFLLFPLLMLAVSFRSKAALSQVPRSVTVAPDWVAFGERRFYYSQQAAISLKPPGARFERLVKISGRNGELQQFNLTLNNSAADFPNYDEFATLLHEAGNAAGCAVRFDYS